MTSETLRGLESGELRPRPQNSEAATLAPILKKEDGRINWSLRADEIARQIRGLRPWPGAFTTFRGAHLHLWMATPSPATAPTSLAVGAAMVIEGRLMVACGDRTMLEVRELQLAGRKRVSARDFLNGARLTPGETMNDER